MMKKLFLWLLIWAFGLAGFASADKLPEWAAPLAGIACEGYDTREIHAVCLLDQAAATFDASGEMETRYRHAYRILTPDGESRGTLVVPLRRGAKISGIRGEVQYPNGEVKSIRDKDTVETQIDSVLFTDVRKRVIILPSVTKGSLICLEYTVREMDEFPSIRWFFQGRDPVLQSRLTVTLPEGGTLSWKAVNLKDFQPSVTGPVYVFSREQVPARPEETMSLPLENLAEQVCIRVTVPKPGPEVRQAGSWPEMANWYRDLTRDRTRVTATIRQLAETICPAGTAPGDKIQKLCNWVQTQIRYVAIQMGQGGFVPHFPDEVQEKKFGDCKDKAFLLMTLLRSQDIPAWPLLCSYRDDGEVDPETFWPYSFNHCIVALEYPAGHLHYFDPTSDTAGYPYLPASLTGSWGLLVHEEQGRLVRLQDQQEAAVTVRAELALSDTGHLTGTVREEYTPNARQSLRSWLRDLNEQERLEGWQRIMADRMPHVVLKKVEWENIFDAAAPLVVKYEVEIRNACKPAGRMLLLNPWVARDLPALSFPGKERKEAILLRELAYRFDYRLTLSYPGNLTLVEEPETVTLKTGFGDLEVVSRKEENRLVVEKKFTGRDVLLEAGQYPEVKKFFNKIRDAREAELLFAKK